MNRYFVSMGLGLSLLLGGAHAVLAAPAPAAKPAEPVIVVPGKALGPISLGMTQQAVIHLLGKPDFQVPPKDGFFYANWDEKKMRVAFFHGKAVLVGTTSDKFRTQDGLKVGATASEIKSHFPKVQAINATGLTGLEDQDTGISFLHHAPFKADGRPDEAYKAPEDWVINEISVMVPPGQLQN